MKKIVNIFLGLLFALLVAGNGYALPPFILDNGATASNALTLDGHAASYFQVDIGLTGKTDSTSTTSSSLAASATAVKTAYDHADTKVPFTSGLASALPGSCSGLEQYYATDTAVTYYCNSDGTFSSKTDLGTVTATYLCKANSGGTGIECTVPPAEKLAVFNFPGDSTDNTVVDSYVPAAATITGVLITTTGAACSAVVDIWADTYANFPATVADTITASAKPTLSTAQKNKDTTLTGWTKAISADSVLRANLDSSDCAGLIQVTLFGTK